MMNNDELLLERLDEMVKLLGLVAKRGVSQTECVHELGAQGFSPKRISEIIGTTPNAVRVALFQHRKKVKGKRAR